MFQVSENSTLCALMKRETGANPVRTRHCDKGVTRKEATKAILEGVLGGKDLLVRRPA